jgi:hypothetical protein
MVCLLRAFAKLAHESDNFAVLLDMELMGVHMDSLDYRRTIMHFSQEDMIPEMDELYRREFHLLRVVSCGSDPFSLQT